jgi:hypothetical protein
VTLTIARTQYRSSDGANASCLCSLLLTWWPSRGAATVPLAEALRYEHCSGPIR